MKLMYGVAVIDGKRHRWPITPVVEKRFETTQKKAMKDLSHNTDIARLVHMAAVHAGDAEDNFDKWLDGVLAISSEQEEIPLDEGSDKPPHGALLPSPSSQDMA